MKPRKNSIRERAKQVPLLIRLYVLYTDEWLKLHPSKTKNRTEKQILLADKFAVKMTKITLDEIIKWQKDGAEIK